MQDPSNLPNHPSPDDLPFLDPAELRASNVIRVDVGGSVVLARRVDLTQLLFTGTIPMPLLAAVEKLTTGIEALTGMPDQDRSSVLQMFRDHACRVVVKPVVVATDDGDASHLPVELLQMPQLMRIWEATTTASVLSATAATRFRPAASPVLEPVAPPGEDLRPAAEQLAPEPAASQPAPEQPAVEIQFA